MIWPSVICFTPDDAAKFVQILDQAPKPASPNHVFALAREKSIRCTTVHVAVSFKAHVGSVTLDSDEYEIVSVLVNQRIYYSFLRKQIRRS